MVGFNLQAFLEENLVDISVVSHETGIPLPTLYAVKKRGTIKLSMLYTLSEKYPNAEKFKTACGELVNEHAKRVKEKLRERKDAGS